MEPEPNPNHSDERHVHCATSTPMSGTVKNVVVSLFLRQNNVDTCRLSEIWLKSIEDSVTIAEDYTFLKERPHAKHDGLCFYITNTTSFIRLHNYEDVNQVEQWFSTFFG